MSPRKRNKAKQNLFNPFRHLSKQIWKLFSSASKRLIQWFLCSLFITSRRTRFSRSGFVLPTTMMLVLVVSIVIAALIVRTSSHTNQVRAESQENYISNAASPAIDRAKAKLEYLFNGDSRLPNGVPGQASLMTLMKTPVSSNDWYKLDDETRLDLKNDGTADDNAWSFRVDSDPQKGRAVNDPTDATIAYSIIGLVPTNQNDLNDQRNPAIQNRANNLLVRNGPVDSSQASAACQQRQQNQQNSAPEDGWFVKSTNTAVLRKNFQVNAVVIPDNQTNGAFATLELQQERQLDRGNKWGAWFRNDIELTQPPVFNWNGAIHTEGSIFVGGNDNFTAYLLSSPSSCVYSRTASEVTTSEITNDQNQITYQGQIVSGAVATNSMQNNTNRFHFLDQNNQLVNNSNNTDTYITQSRDSISDSSNVTPSDIALNPVKIFTQDISEANGVTVSGVKNWTNVRASDWKNKALFTNKRIYNQREPKPYIDDTYRADDRYGPKPTYGKTSAFQIPAGTKIGAAIPSTQTDLIIKDPPSTNIESVGLDGYWERRARNEGLRVIVGQRFELDSPLDPPTSTINHEARQRRTLRDNLAAVQATAIYHQANRNTNGGAVIDLPVACLATTVHPGTATTLKNSATFKEVLFKNASGGDVKIVSDFFTGRGTNGWEYDFFTDYANTLNNSSSSLRKALQNLAYFAGDPDGAYPAKQETSGSIVHPYPELTKYGDFSNLRRALKNLADSSTYPYGYADPNFSIADRSYIDTAACSLGMLADNIKRLQDINIINSSPYFLSGFLSALGSASGSIPKDVINNLASGYKDYARLIYLKEQVDWDRRRGVGYLCTLTAPLNKLCSIATEYEALYYIFPTANHIEDRIDPNSYITRTSVNPPTVTDFYKAIDDTALGAIRLQPRNIDGKGVGSNPWQLPWDSGSTATPAPSSDAPNDRKNPLIKYVNSSGTETVYRVPFKDAGVFNGREMMNVRVLDLDLDLLRQRNPLNINNNQDNWLPLRGIVYAFREDAVREDGIARPATTIWDNCDTADELINTPSCRMNAQTPQDPPINSTNGISTKPVDFYADPDRRSYGFRLKNGVDLTRTLPSGVTDNMFRGISLVSDNPVYIQGNFNLHSTDGSNNNLEEFSETLLTDYTNFYSRSTPEPRFADPNQDRWRSSEIIADAVTILSSNFCDGSIEDSFTAYGANGATSQVPLAQYGCGSGNGRTSYINQNRPNPGYLITDWKREVSGDNSSPIVINKDGSPERTSGTYSGAYYPFNNSTTKPLITAAATRVNTVIVSGLVPSRANQFNGGLHNFPRFLESWTGVNLQISGALIQLNFSTYAAAPWDQDAWEPGSTPISDFAYEYYRPPNRLWGYDVALQMSPAGPVARRFVSPNTTRSEFYRELPVDDPYIQNLRRAAGS